MEVLVHCLQWSEEVGMMIKSSLQLPTTSEPVYIHADLVPLLPVSANPNNATAGFYPSLRQSLVL